MKVTISFFLLSLILGCDVPQRTRLGQERETLSGANTLENSSGTSGTGTLSNNGNSSVTYQPNNPDGSAITNSGNVAGDSRFTNCDLSLKYQTSDIGSFGICQSSTDETLFKVKFTQPSTSTRNCLIPVHRFQDGASQYLGQPQCTLVNQSNSEIIGNLYKNRNGAQSYPLNAVIVMKESSLNGYFECMHSYANWLKWSCPYGVNSSPSCASWIQYCPNGGLTNSRCHYEATLFKQRICDGFKRNYSGRYFEIPTR